MTPVARPLEREQIPQGRPGHFRSTLPTLCFEQTEEMNLAIFPGVVTAARGPSRRRFGFSFGPIMLSEDT